MAFPGGKVDPGESDHEALVRELEEELGVTVTVTGALGTWPIEEWNVRARAYLVAGDWEALVPNPDEVAEVVWLHPTDILEDPASQRASRLVAAALTS